MSQAEVGDDRRESGPLARRLSALCDDTLARLRPGPGRDMVQQVHAKLRAPLTVTVYSPAGKSLTFKSLEKSAAPLTSILRSKRPCASFSITQKSPASRACTFTCTKSAAGLGKSVTSASSTAGVSRPESGLPVYW